MNLFTDITIVCFSVLLFFYVFLNFFIPHQFTMLLSCVCRFTINGDDDDDETTRRVLKRRRVRVCAIF